MRIKKGGDIHIAIDIPIPGPSIEVFVETKVCIERCVDETYMISRCERVNNEEWRPVGFAESFTRE